MRGQWQLSLCQMPLHQLYSTIIRKVPSPKGTLEKLRRSLWATVPSGPAASSYPGITSIIANHKQNLNTKSSEVNLVGIAQNHEGRFLTRRQTWPILQTPIQTHKISEKALNVHLNRKSASGCSEGASRSFLNCISTVSCRPSCKM